MIEKEIKKENEFLPEDVEIREEMAADEEVREHHHHHHHHHRHHRRHHKSSRRGKLSWRKIKKSFQKHKKLWVPVLLILLVTLVAFAILGVVELITDGVKGHTQAQSHGTEGEVVLTVATFEKPVSLVNSATNAILTYEDYSAPAHEMLRDYLEKDVRLDVGVPVTLTFSVTNMPDDYAVEKIVAQIDETDQFLNPWEYTMGSDVTSLDVYNLKTGTQYFYRINVHFTNGSISYAGGTFQTSASPRILTIGGLRNVRDIGGWKTRDGKTVSQGLLYRGTELDGSQETQCSITDEGKTVMLEHLGIRMDMDLRWEHQNTSGVDALGDSVKHQYFGVENYTNIFNRPEYAKAVREIFSQLAVEENYPIYMHCTYGRDRTGTICALLEALLGMEEPQIWYEYQLSALEHNYMDNMAFGNFLVALKNEEGDTLQENAESYLLRIGVTQEEISAIRQIYLR